jgi:hypothetical protein
VDWIHLAEDRDQWRVLIPEDGVHTFLRNNGIQPTFYKMQQPRRPSSNNYRNKSYRLKFLFSLIFLYFVTQT